MWMESVPICLDQQLAQIATSILKRLFWQDAIVKIFLIFAKLEEHGFYGKVDSSKWALKLFFIPVGYFQLQTVLDLCQLPRYAVAASTSFLVEKSFFLCCKKQ